MKIKNYSITLLLLIYPLATIAQNPILKETYRTYSSGKLVGIGTNTSESMLRTVDISISDLNTIVRDYNSNFKYYGFQDFLEKVKKQEKENIEYQRQIANLEKKLERVSSEVDALERKISDIESRIKR